MADFEPRTVSCENCDGHGTILTVRNVSGEMFDADYVSEICPDCDFGEVDAACTECQTVCALDDEFVCRDCSEQLTEVVGNPLRRVA